jgi:uncharacterized protein YciI
LVKFTCDQCGAKVSEEATVCQNCGEAFDGEIIEGPKKKYFVVTYIHSEAEEWMKAHADYIEKLLKDGKLLVSGPFIGARQKSGLLILYAYSREEALELFKNDPLMVHGLVSESAVTEWKPTVGDLESIGK